MFLFPSEPRVIEEDNNHAVFQIEDLWTGYGATIGNALRRVLLSSLEGAAITKVKISGVTHEFSTISGVLEDILTITLNLKQVRFKMFSDEPQTITLSVKGEKKAVAGDFSTPTQVEIINKDCHIASLTSKSAKLEIEARVEKGMGYQPQEAQKGEKPSIGEILLDAFFTPVKKVGFKMENMRVGKRTDFDRLILEIETDGSITPKEAFLRASEILLKHFLILTEGLKDKKEPLAKEGEEAIVFEDLKLPARIINILVKNKIGVTADLVEKTEKELLAIGGLGDKAVKEIKKALKKQKLGLKE